MLMLASNERGCGFGTLARSNDFGLKSSSPRYQSQFQAILGSKRPLRIHSPFPKLKNASVASPKNEQGTELKMCHKSLLCNNLEARVGIEQMQEFSRNSLLRNYHPTTRGEQPHN